MNLNVKEITDAVDGIEMGMTESLDSANFGFEPGS